jgi:DNA-directed RNA polymerase subunit H (RpoH/RPB5)
MHILQPKHSKLREEEAAELLKRLNVSRFQLPKIKIGDAGLPEGVKIGDIIKIERKDSAGKKIYYRVVVE